MKVLTIASEFLKLQPLAAQLQQAGIDTIDCLDLQTVGHVIAPRSLATTANDRALAWVT